MSLVGIIIKTHPAWYLSDALNVTALPLFGSDWLPGLCPSHMYHVYHVWYMPHTISVAQREITKVIPTVGASRVVQNPPSNEETQETGSIPGWGRSSGVRNGYPLLSGESHGQRSHSPRGRTESDTTEPKLGAEGHCCCSLATSVVSNPVRPHGL